MSHDPVVAQRCYRTILKGVLDQRARTGEDLSLTKIAQMTKIQRTYLSQVINRKTHLNSDQLYAVCRVLNLSAEARDQLLLLNEWERSKLEARKLLLERKLAAYEQKNRSSATEPPGNDAFDDYFCDPLGEIVFRFLTMPVYRQAPERLQARLGISESRLREILVSMENCGFIRQDKLGIQVIKTASFPQETSPGGKIRNIQGRLKVAHQKLKQRQIDEFMYNWWFIANPARKKQLKIEYLRLLQDIYAASLHTHHEDVYQLSLDLYTP